MIGIPTLIQPSIDQSMWTSPQLVRDAARQLNGIVPRAAEVGITVGYHNHWWELANVFDGTTALEVFAEELHPSVVLEVDIYWVESVGLRAPDLLGRLGKRVQFMHIKDGDGRQAVGAQVAIGQGRIPVAESLRAAPQAAAVIEIDDFPGDMFSAIGDSISYFHSLGNRS